MKETFKVKNLKTKISNQILWNKRTKRNKAEKLMSRKESSQRRRWATLVLKTMMKLVRYF